MGETPGSPDRHLSPQFPEKTICNDKMTYGYVMANDIVIGKNIIYVDIPIGNKVIKMVTLQSLVMV